MSQQLSLDLALSFEGHPIHAFLHEGQPAWLASEVGAVLGVGDANKALRSSKTVEKGIDYALVTPSQLPATESFSVPRGTTAVTILFESGLYALVLRSNKPAAMRFTRWVIREVLPAIRATGSYSLLPAEFQGEAFTAAQMIKLIDLAGRGNPWAVNVLKAKGLRPAAEEEGRHE